MGMQLNIKREATVELAQELSAALGKSVTDTVHEALEEKRQRREEQIAEKVRIGMEIIAGAAELWHPSKKGQTAKELMDALYDGRGLPI